MCGKDMGDVTGKHGDGGGEEVGYVSSAFNRGCLCLPGLATLYTW